MQEPQSSVFRDLITSLDPWMIAVIAIFLVAWLVIRIRTGAALDPFDRYRPDDADDTYTLEDLRRDYDPADKWNRPPGNHDRL